MDTLHVSCRKASELIERRELRPLGLAERMGLRLHLRICAGCRAYEQQSGVIDRWLEKRRDEGRAADTTELEERIFRRIDPPA